jgi:hypothetical protein
LPGRRRSTEGGAHEITEPEAIETFRKRAEEAGSIFTWSEEVELIAKRGIRHARALARRERCPFPAPQRR